MPDFSEQIANAESAVAYAQQVRTYHRRRTNRKSKQRVTDIDLALRRIRDAMRPLRAEIGRFPYWRKPTPEDLETQRLIRDASLALQRERRKLFKMRPHA